MSNVENLEWWVAISILLIIIYEAIALFRIFVWNNSKIKKLVLAFKVFVSLYFILTSILLITVYFVYKDDRWITAIFPLTLIDIGFVRVLISLWRNEKLNTDTGFKLFYGEWRMNMESDNTNEFIYRENMIIGTNNKLTDRESSYYINKKISIEYPKFNITIVPINEIHEYFPCIMNADEFGIKNTYVTVFFVENGGNILFLIKDDETLIMFYNELNFELKRKSYLNCKNQLNQGDREEEGELVRLRRMEERDVDLIDTDSGYKMFYGEWEINKRAEGSYDIKMNGDSHLFGKRVILEDWKCVYYQNKKERRIGYPKYDIIIMPLNEKTAYLPYMPTMKEMNICGSYAAVIHIRGNKKIFFITKDNNTLIMYYKNNYLELKKIEHVPAGYTETI